MSSAPEPRRATSEIVEQYKIALEMADRVSARRGQANQFYLTLQSSLLGLPAIFGLLGGGTGLDPLRATLITLVGAFTSIAWWLQLRSYRDLNKAKFDVINQIESDYFTVHPFRDEWAALKKDPIPKWRERYAELGTVERMIPALFLAVNLVVGVTAWL